jgi:hypothetical protein
LIDLCGWSQPVDKAPLERLLGVDGMIGEGILRRPAKPTGRTTPRHPGSGLHITSKDIGHSLKEGQELITFWSFRLLVSRNFFLGKGKVMI